MSFLVKSHLVGNSKGEECDLGGYGHSASYGHGSYGEDCCPPVVDPLMLIALLGFTAAATYFLRSKFDKIFNASQFITKI